MKRGTTVFSSQAQERFWAKVEPTGFCWHWVSTISTKGYGRAQMTPINGPRIGRGARRIAYELLVGPIPEGLEIDHLCRIRHCVNPDHLEPVTHAENIRRIRRSSPYSGKRGGTPEYRRLWKAKNRDKVLASNKRYSAKKKQLQLQHEMSYT